MFKLAAALAFAAYPAHAQARALPNGGVAASLQLGVPRDTGRVAAGDTVRLFAGKTELARGILLGSDSFTFVVRDHGDGTTRSVLRANADRAEVKRGDRRRGLQSMGTGALVGMGVGAGVLVLSAANRSQSSEDLGMVIGILVAGLSSVLGTATGAIVGLTYTDAWHPFDPASLVVTPADP